MQVKTTFDDKLKVVEIAGGFSRPIISAARKQWPLSNCSSKMKYLVAAAPDQAYTVYM